MRRSIEIDVSQIREYFSKMGRAAEEFEKEMQTWLETIGEEFLRVVQDEIVQREVVDTRLLLNSFANGEEGNVWRLEEGGMVLEVGSSVEYAKYVNDGHWTIDPTKTRHTVLKDGSLARFVPGVWEGDRFIYNPSAGTGMMLRQQWVDGKPYFDSAVKIMQKMFPDLIQSKMDEWLKKYF